MLNKIKVIGKILPLELKGKSTTQELLIYFSLIVVNPNEARTVLRCHASGKVAIELEKEAREGEMVEVRGYLRNEKENRQIIVQVQEFTKQVKKRDVILLEGFLQTKKVNFGEDIYPEKVVRISSFICQSFVRLDTATVSDFYS